MVEADSVPQLKFWQLANSEDKGNVFFYDLERQDIVFVLNYLIGMAEFYSFPTTDQGDFQKSIRASPIWL